MLINNRYQVQANTDFIDSGGFGKVYKALDTQTNIIIALKQYAITNINERQTLKAEIERAKALAHPNIVKYLDYFETQSTDSLGQQVVEQWAVMEYIAGGNLATFIDTETEQVKQQQADVILNGILQGLDYLHTRRWDNAKNDWIKIIHRDLKPANVLLHKHNGQIIPKICDFGMSKEVLESQNTSGNTSTAANSTTEYAAPELFNPKLRQDGTIQTNYDYWALGVIIYNYFTRQLPFGSRQQGHTQEQIMSAILDDKPNLKPLPEKWRVMVGNCLEKDANKRTINTQTAQNNKTPKPAKTKRGYVLFTVLLTVLVILGLVYFFKDKNKTQKLLSENTLFDTLKISDTKNTQQQIVNDTTNRIPIESNGTIENTSSLIDKNTQNPSTNIEWKKNYDKVGEFYEGYAYILKNNKYGIVNIKGDLIGNRLWDRIRDPVEGYSCVTDNGKLGHILFKEGKLIGNGLEWDDAESFNEGYAIVKRNNKWGFINTNGKLIGNGLEWQRVRDFNKGYAVVTKNGKYGFINTNGKLAWSGLVWDNLYEFSCGYAAVENNNKRGYINTQGNLMWNGLEWDADNFHQEFNNGFAVIEKDGKKGKINTKGEVTWY